jgi:predicted MFS family arabinose efflux permease
MTMPLFAMAAVRSLWQLYLANFVLGGFGFAVLYAPLLCLPGEWVSSRRGLAIGVVTAGGALGQGVVPFLANVLIDEIGWRLALLGLAVTTLIVLILTLPSIRAPVGVDGASRTAAKEHGHSAGKLRFRLLPLSAAAFLCCACMGMPLVHLASFVGSICGSPAVGAASLLVAMLSGTIGRVFFGLIADRLGNLPSYALASALQTTCVAVYPLLGDGFTILLLSAAFGFGFAGNMTCLILCVRDAVPSQRFGTAIGVVMFVAWTGMGAGAYVAGLLFDATLDYALSFRLAATAGLINLLLIGVMIRVRAAAFSASVEPVAG